MAQLQDMVDDGSIITKSLDFASDARDAAGTNTACSLQKRMGANAPSDWAATVYYAGVRQPRNFANKPTATFRQIEARAALYTNHDLLPLLGDYDGAREAAG